jgi:hypothetical protein
MQEHVAARNRPPAFDEAQVPLRYLGFQRQIKLAHAAFLPPIA